MSTYSIQNHSHSSNGINYWNCICKCGNEIILSNLDFNLKFTGCNECKSFNGNIAPYKQIYKRYKNSAKIRGIDFDISLSFFKKFIENPCVYCGVESSLEYKCGNIVFKYNGIDRSNNNEGYEHSNCYTCCKICNRAKNDLSLEEFETWIKRLKMRGVV